MNYLNKLHHKLILASASPRRAQLLKQIGLEFEIIPSNIDESSVPVGCNGTRLDNHAERAKWMAREKARAVAKRVSEGTVIGADTVVVYAGEAIGKPKDLCDAVRILKMLRCNTHEVITGVALVDAQSKRESVWAEKTVVHFRQLSDTEIMEYVEIERPLDKAGSYGIQERAATFVKRIEGCYFNVVGLPLAALTEKLKQFRVRLCGDCPSFQLFSDTTAETPATKWRGEAIFSESAEINKLLSLCKSRKSM